MFEEFDKYILEFAKEDFAIDYWYDEGAGIAENMLDEFDDNDWKALLETISKRTIEWKKRLAYCLHDGSNYNQLRVLLGLVDTDDKELFEIVVDSLRDFTDEESVKLIQNDSQIFFKVKELLPESGDAEKRMYQEFLKRFSKKNLPKG